MYVHVQKKRCISLADEVDTSIDGFSLQDIDMTDSADTPGNDNVVDEVLQEEFPDAILYEYFDTNHGHHNKLRAFESGFLQLTDQKGVSKEVQRHLISFINKHLLDCVAPEACIQEYDVCVNSCYLFMDDDQAVDCPNPKCKEKRFKDNSKVSREIMPCVSIGEALTHMLLDDDNRELFDFKHTFNLDDNQLVDIFSGKTSSFCIVKGLLVKKISALFEENMIMPLGVIASGPEKTYDLMSFLKPFIEEVGVLSTKGMTVVKNNRDFYTGRVFILGITGDIPVIASLMNHQGHQSTSGCRMCKVTGERRIETSHGM
ncbi:uncharacterized protein EV154DRAFT_574527 [Mucor mucedo]|uniref:uncharacterized protein n=1 Tax=Mucor mucedo TaxID=29922 RepID=UPI00221EC2CE|nr:uncharacterized protein EV154DRAFT_574527 [Mucor mucedo]KAI7884997.1 hypothetical protein EV154DRAFT_574527 [Mucor mucedo]